MGRMAGVRKARLSLRKLPMHPPHHSPTNPTTMTTKLTPEISIAFGFEAKIPRKDAARTLRELRKQPLHKPGVIRRSGHYRLYTLGNGPCVMTVGL